MHLEMISEHHYMIMCNARRWDQIHISQRFNKEHDTGYQSRTMNGNSETNNFDTFQLNLGTWFSYISSTTYNQFWSVSWPVTLTYGVTAGPRLVISIPSCPAAFWSTWSQLPTTEWSMFRYGWLKRSRTHIPQVSAHSDPVLISFRCFQYPKRECIPFNPKCLQSKKGMYSLQP